MPNAKEQLDIEVQEKIRKGIYLPVTLDNLFILKNIINMRIFEVASVFEYIGIFEKGKIIKLPGDEVAGVIPYEYENNPKILKHISPDDRLRMVTDANPGKEIEAIEDYGILGECLFKARSGLSIASIQETTSKAYVRFNSCMQDYEAYYPFIKEEREECNICRSRVFVVTKLDHMIEKIKLEL